MNKDNEFVSIIIPIYNVKEYLSKCIDSVLNQTYPKIEVLLVDDGSTDGCAEMIDKLDSDDRIRVFHKENGGLSDARNYGLDRAKGDYIFFLDSDDYLEPEAIEKCLNAMSNTNCDIVECRVRHITNEVSFIHSKPQEGVYDKQQAIEGILDYKYRIVAWNKLYRAFLWRDIRFPVGKINEDEHTIPYIVEKCNCYTVIKEPLYNYVQRQGSIMNSSFNEGRLSIIDAYEKRIKYFSEKYEDKYTPIIEFRYSLVLGRVCFEAKGTPYVKLLRDKRNSMIKRVLQNKRISFERKIKSIVFCMFPRKAYSIMRNSTSK